MVSPKEIVPLIQFEQDLESMIALWNEHEHFPEKCDDPQYLSNLSKIIFTLEDHTQTFIHEPALSHIASLVDFLLKTPWGAPFVANDTLFSAAEQLNQGDGKPLSSLLRQCNHFRHRVRSPIIFPLRLLLDELYAMHRQAA